MKKLVKNILAIVLTLPLLIGCDSFLEVSNYTSKDASTFPRTAKDVDELVTGVYAQWSFAQQDGRQVETSYLYVAELASDERYGGGGMNDFDFQAMGHLMYVSPNFMNGAWVNNYRGIARANEALRALNTIENYPEARRDQRIGELKTLRAMFYYTLVKLLGDVPIVTGAPANVQAAANVPPESSQEEVYKVIAKDLWEAYNQMSAQPWDHYPSGTMTKWAAGSMLARVYLFYTGFYRTGTSREAIWGPEDPNRPRLTSMPMNDSDGKTSLTDADIIAILNDVIQNSGHKLTVYFQQNWPYSNRATARTYQYMLDLNQPDNIWILDGLNPESVLVAKCAPAQGSYRNALPLYFGLRQGSRLWPGSFPLGRGWGSGAVNPRMWNEWLEYEGNEYDIRRKASIFHYAEEPMPGGYLFGMETQYEETGLWGKKHMPFQAHRTAATPHATESTWICWEFAPTNEGGFGIGNLWSAFANGNGTDIKHIRFADVLLMHAELTNGATIPGDGFGTHGVNIVRRRVGLSDVVYSEFWLRSERRFELAFEGVRWSDIRRWHIAGQVLPNQYGGRINNIDVVTTQRPQSQGGVAERYKVTKGFWMKPQTQLDLAPGLLTQNPGWGPEHDARYFFWRSSL